MNVGNVKWTQNPFNQSSLNIDDLEPRSIIVDSKSSAQYLSTYFDYDFFKNVLLY